MQQREGAGDVAGELQHVREVRQRAGAEGGRAVAVVDGQGAAVRRGGFGVGAGFAVGEGEAVERDRLRPQIAEFLSQPHRFRARRRLLDLAEVRAAPADEVQAARLFGAAGGAERATSSASSAGFKLAAKFFCCDWAAARLHSARAS